MIKNYSCNNAAPYTPAESPNLFLRMGVSTKSEKTFS